MKKIKNKIIVSFFFLFMCLSIGAATCQGHVIDPVTDICWACLFPITIGSSQVVHSGLPDTDNPGNPMCVCEWNPLPVPGLAMGYWEPMALVDVTRTPYCLVNLGGQQLHNDDIAQGAVETQSPDQGGSFYEVHYYNFPLLQWADPGLLGGSCQTDGDFNLTYLSELDPTWHDESLAAIAFPETQGFANPISAMSAHAACAYDSVKANTGLPSDFAFWCAGSQGFMYPLTGKVVEHIGAVQASTLLAERLVFKLHRMGRISDTSSHNLCHEQIDPMMSKSRYRYQMVYPHPNACQPFGRTTMIWGANQMNPLTSDDTGYVIWRKRNCCNY